MPTKSLIFMLDVSGTMQYDGKHVALMEAMRQVCEDVFPNVNPPEDLELNVRILTFGGQTTWVLGDADSGVPYTDLIWNDIKTRVPSPGGGTPIGASIKQVCDTLYRNGGVVDTEQVAPAIILVSDGAPTDDYAGEYQRAKDLKFGIEKQGLFSRSLRATIGIGLGNDTEGQNARTMLEGFGRLSRSLKRQGLKHFYDITVDHLDELAKIVMSMTEGFSETPDWDS